MSTCTCSFEFFPPKTEKGAETLYETIQQLENLRPSFVSVTYGAGGSTRDLTHDLVVRIKDSTSLDPIPHLTVVCHGEDEIRSILERYAQAWAYRSRIDRISSSPWHTTVRCGIGSKEVESLIRTTRSWVRSRVDPPAP